MTPPFPQPHYFFTHGHTATSSPAPHNAESGTATPATSSAPGSATNSPPMVHSPGLETAHLPVSTSALEDDQLQLLPPIVAAGSMSTSSVENRSAAAPRPCPVQVVPLLGTKGNGDQAHRERSPYIDKPQHPHENGGALTPRAKFIETLQSKTTAWDALIHGSFS